MNFSTIPTFIKENLTALVCLVCIFMAYILVVEHNLTTHLFEQTIWQAEALLEGSLAVNANKFMHLDIVYTESGEAYWPLGIFPAIVVLPFVALSDVLEVPMYQGFLLPFITLAVYVLAVSLARKFQFRTLDALLLGAVFCLGSGYILMTFEPWTWYFNQSIGVLMLLLGLNEWYGRKRLWLIGIYMSLLLHTRYISALAIAFFCLEILRDGSIWKEKVLKYLQLLIPFALAVVMVFALNIIRFGDPLDTGYSRSETEHTMKAAREEYGFFSLRNIPNNLYWYFIAGTQPIVDERTLRLEFPYIDVSKNGYGFFYLSPFFLAIFFYFVWDRRTWSLWIVSTAILLILLTHFTTGYFTFGPRYMMDLFPLWYAILLISLPYTRLSQKQMIFITCSILLNVVLIVWSIPRIWGLP